MLKYIGDYYVYEHLFPNNKRYIGITSNPKQRWANGSGYNHNKYMQRAIKKYGWNNIQHNILFSNVSKYKAENIERELIAYYKSNNPKFGYNIDNGGNSIGKHSESTLKKLRQYANNRPKSHNENISKGKTGKKLNLSDVQREKISLRFKGNHYGIGRKNFLGKHHTVEAKLKISLSRIGKPSWIKGKHRTEQHTLNNVLAHQKPILQYDIELNLMGEYPSIKDAMQKTHINNIGKACRGVQKTAGGYIWKYKTQAGLVEKVVE